MSSRLFTGILALSIVATAPASPIVSTFDAGPEGWSYVDFVGAGDYSVIGGGAVNWQVIGGNPGGQISVFDPSSGSFFFQAPSVYLGDQSTALAQTFSFDLRTDFDTWGGDNALLLVGNGGQMIAAQIAQPAVNTWQTFTIPLQAANFRTGNLSGAVVTDGAFAAILADLEAIYIPGEFATGLIERTLIDNVVLVPEPAGLALLGLSLLAARRR